MEIVLTFLAQPTVEPSASPSIGTTEPSPTTTLGTLEPSPFTSSPVEPVPVQLTDGTPLLTTLIQSGAALVAIIAGLLIARLVALASERAGLERRMSELTELRAVRAKDLEEARSALLDEDAEDFIDDVCDEFFQYPERKFAEWYDAYVEANEAVRSADELRPYFDQFIARIKRVSKAIEYDTLLRDEEPTDWYSTDKLDLLEKIKNPRDYEIALGLIKIIEDNWDERNHIRRSQVPFPGFASDTAIGAARQQISAVRYMDLVRNDAAAEGALEIVDLELVHTRQALELVRRPEGLTMALVVLAGIAVGGIVIPLMHLTFGSPQVTPALRATYSGLFVLSILAFFGYLLLEMRRIVRPQK